LYISDITNKIQELKEDKRIHYNMEIKRLTFQELEESLNYKCGFMFIICIKRKLGNNVSLIFFIKLISGFYNISIYIRLYNISV